MRDNQQMFRSTRLTGEAAFPNTIRRRVNSPVTRPDRFFVILARSLS